MSGQEGEGMLTLFVPTRNRPEFVRRLLSFYASCKVRFPILMGDSSDEGELQQTLQMVGGFRGKLQVTHLTFPTDCGTYEASTRLLQSVSTPYVVFCPDDDFLIPATLEKAVRFLEDHPDYNAVSGAIGLMRLSSPSDVHGKVDWVEPYPQISIEHEDAGQRLEVYLRIQTSVFSVYRTQVMLANYRKVLALGLDHMFTELLTGCLAVIDGKSKRLSCLYMVRQAHPNQSSFHHDLFDWIADSRWPRLYACFSNCLAQELSRKERVSQEETLEIVKRVFWFYLANVLTDAWRDHYARVPSRLRQTARSLSLLRSLWYGVRPAIPGMEQELSLPALLRPRSRYHSEFMPVYQVMTQGGPICAS